MNTKQFRVQNVLQQNKEEMEMKKEFRTPELEISVFKTENIILTSGVTQTNVEKAAKSLTDEKIEVSLQTLITL